MSNNQIRNFVIISHIDHGKSTLADRFLELTQTIPKDKMRPQYLDMMDLERERGITIKMAPVRMKYQLPPDLQKIFNFFRPWRDPLIGGQFLIFNLIDTPGHVDFSYEVSRALAAVEGAILLVDAGQGIQAQTIANLELAKKQKLVIIPVINKIDLITSNIEENSRELANLLGKEDKDIIKISAKNGTNIKELLEKVIEVIPAPKGDTRAEFRALIFDSKYDVFKGVVAYVRIVEGEIRVNDKIYLIASQTEGQAKEIGYFKPELSPEQKLTAGEIGYIATGIKEPGRVRVGDTITKLKIKNEKLKIIEVKPLAGYQEPKPMIFTSLYPENPDDFELLKESLEKLKLNDASFVFQFESREGLGRGYQCGFLGGLHAEIIFERLQREFGLNLVISRPSVCYKIIRKDGKELFIQSAQDFPLSSEIKEVQEPWAKVEVITLTQYLGKVFEILEKLSGKHQETKHFGSNKILIKYEAPLRKIIVDFYDDLKSQTQGFSSMNYSPGGWRVGDLLKLDILIAGQIQEVFSRIIERKEAFREGQKIVRKLKETLPAQLFSVALQAAIEGRIICRETIRAKGRDVIAPLYGGDYTRKRKLLEKQKKGKKELKEKGRVQIPAKVFLEVLKMKV